MRTIVGVFARHGFYQLLEKINLGKFILARLNPREGLEHLSIPERVRLSFEELGPTFVKFGQLLASRPDLVPEDYVNEFKRLHDRVAPLEFETVLGVLREEYGDRFQEIFADIERSPMGSASIAQVHKARLVSGEEVVVKVQRPGIVSVINDDLNVMYFIAELLETYVADSKTLNPVGIVHEFFRTLDLETNFVIEANNIRRFQKNFETETDVKIPAVYVELTTERVLVMEALKGLPLSQPGALNQPGTQGTAIVKIGLRAYIKMVFQDGLFHGDLHAGNFFVFPDNKIGLIDFGVVGRLNPSTQTSIAHMLLALAREDYERLAYEYVDIAPFNERVNVDLFAKDLRELIAPFYGLSLKNVNLGKLLMSSSGIAAKYGLVVPTDLMLFFKSIVNIEGVGRSLDKDFDFLEHAISLASELVQKSFEPQKLANELSQIARESRNLISTLPRQINLLFRKLNNPDHAFKLQLTDSKDLKRAIEASFNLLFLGLIIGALIVSASMIYIDGKGPLVAGLPAMSFAGYALSVVLGMAAFINYIRKP